MPIHDWTRVDAVLFHDFNLSWTVALSRALNAGGLPAEYYALIEKKVPDEIPDLRVLELPAGSPQPKKILIRDEGTLSVGDSPPKTRWIRRAESKINPLRGNRIAIRHRDGDVVAMIEVVLPGIKKSRSAFASFAAKTAAILRQGVNLLVLDLFPPTVQAPQGVHKAIWDEFQEEEFALPPDKPLLLAAYDAGPPAVAYLEPAAPGDCLPDMPLFLNPEVYMPLPLELTYLAAWEMFPAPLKGPLETPEGY
jgi:hypothetical protein